MCHIRSCPDRCTSIPESFLSDAIHVGGFIRNHKHDYRSGTLPNTPPEGPSIITLSRLRSVNTWAAQKPKHPRFYFCLCLNDHLFSTMILPASLPPPLPVSLPSFFPLFLFLSFCLCLSLTRNHSRLYCNNMKKGIQKNVILCSSLNMIMLANSAALELGWFSPQCCSLLAEWSEVAPHSESLVSWDTT